MPGVGASSGLQASAPASPVTSFFKGEGGGVGLGWCLTSLGFRSFRVGPLWDLIVHDLGASKIDVFPVSQVLKKSSLIKNCFGMQWAALLE